MSNGLGEVVSNEDGEGVCPCVGVKVLLSSKIEGGEGVSRSIGRSSVDWGGGDGGLIGLFKISMESGEGGSKSIKEDT